MFSNDSVFVKFESCPSCGSRDNLSVWSDGHKWCFGCSYYVKPTGETLTLLKNKINISASTPTKTVVTLPKDASFNLPAKCREWLDNFFVSPVESARWKFKWSQELGGLILPIYDDDEQLVCYQVRRFDNQKPKYLTFGKLDNFVPVYGEYDNGVIVIVEDIISARRVSEVCNATPLLGCHLSRSTASRLSRGFDRCLLWLDSDKLNEANTFYQQYRNLFTEMVVTSTPLDPKSYSSQQLLEYVYENFEYDDLTSELDLVNY